MDICRPGGGRRHNHHPLAPSLGLSVRQAKEAAAAKEKQKVANYAHLIREKQLNFIPVAITTFGAMGPQATQFEDDAAEFYSSKCAEKSGGVQKWVRGCQDKKTLVHIDVFHHHLLQKNSNVRIRSVFQNLACPNFFPEKFHKAVEFRKISGLFLIL